MPRSSKVRDATRSREDARRLLREIDLVLREDLGAAADEILRAVKVYESQVTVHMKAIAQAHKARLRGVKFRLKSRDSLVRKLATILEQNHEHELSDACAAVRDALRYTMTFGEQRYTDATREVMTSVAGHYEFADLTNYWNMPTYKGVNSWAAYPGESQFEVQFHTLASWDTKHNKTHEFYEELRTTTDPVRRRALYLLMVSLWKAVRIPRGALTIRLRANL